MASGLAVLSYANAAALELIVSQQNGVLVPNGDELAFVNASVALALDTAMQAKLRMQAPGSVAYLAWSAVADSFEGVLREVLSRHTQTFSAVYGTERIAQLQAQERLAHPHVSPLL
jgi:glycosyltransferase involved in cell wall biosynthesis